jgi:dTDP-4-amino-4,6-dideoxygalactose transaminase
MFSACHNFVIKATRRDELRASLMEQGITTGVHYYPNHLFDMYRPWYRKLPVTEKIWQELVTLPLFPDLAEADFTLITTSIRDFYA